jgi:dienelactone hydrolase
MSCAETDHTFPAESRHRAEELLTKGKRVYNIQFFSGVEHGFALRCNLEDKYESAWLVY